MKKAPTIKIRTSFSDGVYSAEPYVTAHERAGMSYVEMDVEDWAQYKRHITEARKWHTIMRDLDNDQFAKDHAAEKLVVAR